MIVIRDEKLQEDMFANCSVHWNDRIKTVVPTFLLRAAMPCFTEVNCLA